VSELRLARWEEVRLPIIMALVFNGTSFVSSLVELTANGVTWAVAVIGSASLLFTLAFTAALVRKGT
jgi:hypothetical protein